jgi:hypothetical protein
VSTDLAITLGIVAVAALILHLKSHVKFIAMGAFIGLVLAETVGAPFQEYLSSRVGLFSDPDTVSIIQLFLLVVPAFLLGINHAGDKKRLGLGRTVATVVSTTLFLLANILAYLPAAARDELVERSTLAQQLEVYRIWLIVLAAVVIMADSFHHKRLLQAKKKSKKSK